MKEKSIGTRTKVRTLDLTELYSEVDEDMVNRIGVCDTIFKDSLMYDVLFKSDYVPRNNLDEPLHDVQNIQSVLITKSC